MALARRYRPQTFAEVVGQHAVLSTLHNALRFDKAAHAYLFCGSRGVGKTTLARLFAKALNCQMASVESNFEPCNQCPSCIEINSGQSLDVIEIDGASNRGIDDIRQINETVYYAPSRGKYKIYIIDEVHMLTKEAFNALLKTLEEPPTHVKFFFATTEPHKVLPTILSRCQRFDLQRLTEQQIFEKLLGISAELDREVLPEALQIIASFSDGSLRDAESLLDQIFCFTEGPISADRVRDVLGLSPTELFLALDTAFAEGRHAFAFELVEELSQRGRDLGHFLEQLVHHYRHLALFKVKGSSSLSDSMTNILAPSAQHYSQPQLFYILDILLPFLSQWQKSPAQRASLEMMLLQILRSKNRIPIEILVRRLDELEQKLSSTAPTDYAQDGVEQCKMEESKACNPIDPSHSQIEKATETTQFHKTESTPSRTDDCRHVDISHIDTLTVVDSEDLSRCPKLEESAIEVVPKQDTKKEPTKEVPSGHYETLMRFAAVELEGTLESI